jgi:[ribosomal protein S5]-alanine N-acetyltransferase
VAQISNAFDMQTTNHALSFSGYALQQATPSDASSLLAYYLRNRERLRPWEPTRHDSFYTMEGMTGRLTEFERQIAENMALYLFIRRTIDGSIVGECNFSNIVRGPFQACYLGFSIDGEEEGKGLMYAALQTSINYVFDELKLHRIMANYRPENTRSGALLARLGFSKEGIARRYLKINDVWTDHVLTAKTNDSMEV